MEWRQSKALKLPTYERYVIPVCARLEEGRQLYYFGVSPSFPPNQLEDAAGCVASKAKRSYEIARIRTIGRSYCDIRCGEPKFTRSVFTIWPDALCVEDEGYADLEILADALGLSIKELRKLPRMGRAINNFQVWGVDWLRGNVIYQEPNGQEINLYGSLQEITGIYFISGVKIESSICIGIGDAALVIEEEGRVRVKLYNVPTRSYRSNPTLEFPTLGFRGTNPLEISREVLEESCKINTKTLRRVENDYLPKLKIIERL